MWQNIISWAKYFLHHKEQTEKNSTDIKEQERTIREMTNALQHLAFEYARQRENEVHEREKLALRLENILLRERSLPVGSVLEETHNEQLLRQIEELKNDNQVLLKRLDEFDK